MAASSGPPYDGCLPAAANTPLAFRHALTAFQRADLERLRRYHRKAEELRASHFLSEPQHFRTRTDSRGQVAYEISNASREVVSAIVAPLRLLYSQRDNVSFNRIRAMIGRHASSPPTKDAAALLALLAFYKTRLNQGMSFDPDMGIFHVDEAGEVTPIHVPTTREIFEDWLYGEFLHDDEERLSRIEDWRSIGIHEFLFLSTARELATLYVEFADRVVGPILNEPRLAAS